MSEALDDILAAFERLVAQAADGSEGSESPAENFRCVDCVDCSACRFCTACRECVDCTYCDACDNCESCTQSRGCFGCKECSHSHHSGHCESSSYLGLCFDCDNCVYCFACVGLSGEEFCILNEKYTRRDYFKRVGELKAELDDRILAGWRPPWDRDRETADDNARSHEPSSAQPGLPPPPPTRAEWDQQPALSGLPASSPPSPRPNDPGALAASATVRFEGADEGSSRPEPDADDEQHSDWSANFAAAPSDAGDRSRRSLTRAAPPERPHRRETGRTPQPQPSVGGLRWGRSPKRKP